MKKLTSLLLLVIVIMVAIFAASPYYRAYQLKTAFEDKNGALIAAAIDYETLKPSIKTQLKDKFAVTIKQYPAVVELGGAPLMEAANGFIDNAVNDAITAQNVEKLITTQGQANNATKELAAAWAIASNQINLKTLIRDMIIERGDIDAVVKKQVNLVMNNQAQRIETAKTAPDAGKPELHYCGINCFTISGVIKGYPVTVEMARQGFTTWKIVDVTLPE